MTLIFIVDETKLGQLKMTIPKQIGRSMNIYKGSRVSIEPIDRNSFKVTRIIE